MAPQNLMVTLDGKAIEANDGDNLLESLLSNGADVHYGCRAGVCGACRLYDQTNCESILCCQTPVTSTMSLTTQAPFTFVAFTLLTKNTLDDSTIELTLLGPSDDSFGDRVTLCFAVEGKEVFCECMALNPAGAPLTIMVQASALEDAAWQQVQSLTEKDKVQVTSPQGVRKGRLLYEMGLGNASVVVVSSSDNRLFEAHWREALAGLSSQMLGHFSLPSLDSQLGQVNLNSDGLMHFLQEKIAEAGSSSSLHVVYQGQNISQQDWEVLLRSVRVRVSQLHFVR